MRTPLLDSSRARAALLTTLLGVAILWALLPFMGGILGALVLYVLGKPLYQNLARSISPAWAATVVIVLFSLIILVPGGVLVGMLIEQAPEAFRSIREGPLFTRLQTLRIGPFDVGAQLARASGTIISWVSGQALGLFGSMTKAVLNLVIALFGLYYLLQHADAVWTRVRGFLPFSTDSANALRDRFFSVTQATIAGTLAIAIGQGFLVGLGFAIAGLPSPVVWGTVTAFCSILPLFGSALVWIPGAVTLAVQGRYAGVAVLVVAGVVASNVDNVIRPIIFKRVSDVHPLTTLIGAFAALPIFGLIGVLLGPLAIEYFFDLVRIYEAEYGDGRPPAPDAESPPVPPPAEPVRLDDPEKRTA